jgi:hypothetical protein
VGFNEPIGDSGASYLRHLLAAHANEDSARYCWVAFQPDCLRLDESESGCLASVALTEICALMPIIL